MDFSQTKLSFRRSFLSYSKVQFIIAALVRNRPFFLKQRALRRKAYLDIGCGPNLHHHFINLDYTWCPGIDICWDITKPIPLPDGVLKGVYSEHCLEHVTIETAEAVLRESWRLLRPGGTLRIVMPDGELYLTGGSCVLLVIQVPHFSVI